MLREIGSARPDACGRVRRWFQDDHFDLYVWHDDTGRLIAFQLCYDRHGAEGAISWSQATGYSHARVDDGRMAAGVPSTPLLIGGRPLPYFRVYQRFLEASGDWPEAELRSSILGRLQAYRAVLFGRRRPVRRRRARAAR
jgi:hypothetical protein